MLDIQDIEEAEAAMARAEVTRPPSNPSYKFHEVRDHVYLAQGHVTQFSALGLAQALNILHELTF